MAEPELPEGPHPRLPVARRVFLRTAAAGTAAVAAWSLLRETAARAASTGGGTARAAATGPASAIIPLDTGWMFGPPGGGALVPVTLPHTVTRLSWEKWDPASWEKKWLYTNAFDDPRASGTGSGMRVFLDFAGAMTHSTVTLNDAKVADFLGGYLPFSAEITSHLRPTSNQLSVLLDATFNLDVPPDRPGSASMDVDFWQPGGIYRDVHLRVVPQVFISDVYASPAKASETAPWTVPVQVTVDAAIVPAGTATVTVQLLDGTNVVSSSTTSPVSIPTAGTTVTASTTLTGLGTITLWDIKTTSQKLYTVVATLLVDGAPIHDYQVQIGFRTIQFRDDGFWLNGRRVKLFGLNRHQFYPFAGGAMPARVQAKDAQILREELNCNMVRCSHYPQSEDFLTACDRLGLMVWEEAPGWDYIGGARWKDLTYRDVRSMIIRDRNHPSVIIWGVRLNETQDDQAFYTMTESIATHLDTRPTVGAMSSLSRHPNLDGRHYEQKVYSFNDYSSSLVNGVRTPTLKPVTALPDMPYMISEAIGALSGPSNRYRRTDSQATQQGQATAHGRVHDIAASSDRYCGLLAWSGFDYPSGNGENPYNGVKYTGVADQFRIPKPGAAIYQAQVPQQDAHVIAPAFYWDFGATSPVNRLTAAMICSNLDSLEVIVDGQLHVTVRPDRANYGHLMCAPSFVDFSTVDGSGLPELHINGYIGSTMVASRRFSASHAGDSLFLKADDVAITGDGVDATRVVFRAVDKYGAPRPYVQGAVTFTITGPHVLVGDNKFDFTGTGAAGAIWIRSQPHSSGSITVKASHPTLHHADATTTISVTKPPAIRLLGAAHKRKAAIIADDDAAWPSLGRPSSSSVVASSE